MPTYDSLLFDPPAPLARITLRNPSTGRSVDDVPMLIDSGADLTLIPRTFAGRLNIDSEEEGEYELEGFDGRKSVARVVHLELIFLRRTFKGRFVILDSDIGIIVRNVLNQFPILLDGPNRFWREAVGPFR